MVIGIPEIAIVDYDGAQAAAVLGMSDLLTAGESMARQGGKASMLRISHWKRKEAAPERVFDTHPDRLDGQPTVIVIPPGLGDPLPEIEAKFYAEWLRAQYSMGAVLCSICKGAFLLGETGLLAGRTVTTHWAYEEQLTARFPDVKINTDRLIIDDGDIVTAGGVMAWIDLSLKLVERFLGPAAMVSTARSFLSTRLAANRASTVASRPASTMVTFPF